MPSKPDPDLDLHQRVSAQEAALASLTESIERTDRSIERLATNTNQAIEQMRTSMEAHAENTRTAIENTAKENKRTFDEISKVLVDRSRTPWTTIFGALGVTIGVLGVYIKSETGPIASRQSLHESQLFQLEADVRRVDKAAIESQLLWKLQLDGQLKDHPKGH